MSALHELLDALPPAPLHRPWPRAACDRATWIRAGEELSSGRLTLLGLWGERARAHLALLEETTRDVAVLSLECPDHAFPSIGALHAPALRLERAMKDLFGLVAEGAPDARPWLDHGKWGVEAPLGDVKPASAGPPYTFLPVEGESLHQIPVGPVHAGIIEPGHFRFTANGETVVRLEQRLGYVHKGVERLMAGLDLAEAAKLAQRVSGDSTVAYAIAFARAAEAALQIEAPPRATMLRAIMAELERLANHFGDIGAICNDAAFALIHAHCAVLRERVLRASDACFGHRLMRDCITPGGIIGDVNADAAVTMPRHLRDWRKKFNALMEIYDETSSLQDRTVGAGVLSPELARRFGAGGFVGRASGRGFDARTAFAYPPYDKFVPEVVVLKEGDVDARVRIRIHEARQSLTLLERMFDALPYGSIHVESGSVRGGEGMALVEGFRGDILAWLRIGDDGRVARCHLRDPSWFQWPLLEAAIENNIVGDFPLCNKSFNCSYSGHDL